MPQTLSHNVEIIILLSFNYYILSGDINHKQWGENLGSVDIHFLLMQRERCHVIYVGQFTPCEGCLIGSTDYYKGQGVNFTMHLSLLSNCVTCKHTEAVERITVVLFTQIYVLIKDNVNPLVT